MSNDKRSMKSTVEDSDPVNTASKSSSSTIRKLSLRSSSKVGKEAIVVIDGQIVTRCSQQSKKSVRNVGG